MDFYLNWKRKKAVWEFPEARSPKSSRAAHLCLLETREKLILGKIKGRRRLGRQRMRWLDDIIDSKDMSLSKLWELVMDKPGVLWFVGSQKVRHDRGTELNWTEGNWINRLPHPSLYDLSFLEGAGKEVIAMQKIRTPRLFLVNKMKWPILTGVKEL